MLFCLSITSFFFFNLPDEFFGWSVPNMEKLLMFVQAGQVESHMFSSEVLSGIVFPMPQHSTQKLLTLVPMKRES